MVLDQYDVCFYLDNEKLDLEHMGKFYASSEEEAVKTAIQELNPTEKGFFTVMLWGSPD